MKLNELRVGHIIQYDNDERLVEVTGMHGKIISYNNDRCESPVKYMKPVKINTKTLKKIGFIKEYSPTYIIYQHVINGSNTGVLLVANEGGTFRILTRDKNLTYINDLQDEYLIKTGNKLTLV